MAEEKKQGVYVWGTRGSVTHEYWFERGRGVRVTDGHLNVLDGLSDDDADVIAVFAPGKWSNAEVLS